MDDVTFIFEVHGKNKFLSSRRVSVEQDSMSNNKSENIETTPWFLIPYINITADKFLTICKNENLKPAFYNNNKFNSFIKEDVQKEFSQKIRIKI